MVWDFPYYFGLERFVDADVIVHIWSSHLHGKLLDLFECSGVTLGEAHTMDALVNVNGVFYSHYLVDGRMALLATLLCGSLSAWPKLES